MDSSAEFVIQGEELLALVREQLSQGRKVRYLPFQGVSMLPMLRQGIDSVELSPLPERLKKYDLPVYQYPSGKVVMHRVVAVREKDYLCLGDNTYVYETVTHDQMIGVVSAFRRGEKRIEADALGYRLYSRVWCALFPVRKFMRRVYHWLRRRLK